MENNPIQSNLLQVQSKIGRELSIDQNAIDKNYNNDRHGQSMTIKVLSIFGGILATAAFVGFLLISRLEKSEIFTYSFSAIFFITSIWMNKRFDKVILDTISVCMYLLGYGLFAMGFNATGGTTSQAFGIILLFALITLFISRSYILTFIAILIATGSSISRFNHWDLPGLNNALLLVLGVFILYFTFNEGKLMKIKAFSGKRYLSIRTGLAFSYMICLYFVSSPVFMVKGWIITWLTSGILIAMIFWLVNCLLNRFLCEEVGKKIFIFLVILICLGFTAMNPAIAGALLLLLVSFKVNYKTGIALGIIGFIYFIGMFYYDLNISLLHKSIAMFISGVFFLLLYLMIFKKSKSHEKA